MSVREGRSEQYNSEYNNNTTTEFNWGSIISQFNLSKDYVHVGASQFISSHPKPVREAIARYRRALDANPALYTLEHEKSTMQEVRRAAARFLSVDDADNIAMTDSTTMGIGTIYTGLDLKPEHEVLITKNAHYSQKEAVKWATKRTGASSRMIDLYSDPRETRPDEIVENLLKEIKDNTRVVGITWVHSSDGVKTPVVRIGEEIAELNKNRDEEDKILFLVDGVHGFGVELETFPDIGCDFFIAGCHKWLYGPRGTGLVAATPEAWQLVMPIIPSFTEVMLEVIEKKERPDRNTGVEMTPGGFHSMEYRWALKDAFEFMESIGKERIYERVHALNRQCKEGLAAMPHVTLHTPISDELSSGIVSFEINGISTKEAVSALQDKKIVATASPYKETFVRFTPGIINTPEDIEKALDAVYSLK